MGRSCGVVTGLLAQPVSVAQDVEVPSSVPPQCGVLKGRSRPEGAVADLKRIVQLFILASAPSPSVSRL